MNSIGKIEKFLLTQFDEQEKSFHIKELNELAEENGCANDADCSEGGKCVGWIHVGDRTFYNKVDFGTGSEEITFRVASAIL